MTPESEGTGNTGKSVGFRAPPSPRAYRRRLANVANVKTALADAVRAIEDETMDIQRARVLVYALSVLANVITDSDLERRVAELEKGKP